MNIDNFKSLPQELLDKAIRVAPHENSMWFWPTVNEKHILGLGFFENLIPGSYGYINGIAAFVPEQNVMYVIPMAMAETQLFTDAGYHNTLRYVPGANWEYPIGMETRWEQLIAEARLSYLPSGKWDKKEDYTDRPANGDLTPMAVPRKHKLFRDFNFYLNNFFKNYRQSPKSVVLYEKFIKKRWFIMELLLNIFFISFGINIFIIIYFIYSLFEIFFLQNHQGSKLKFKKNHL